MTFKRTKLKDRVLPDYTNGEEISAADTLSDDSFLNTFTLQNGLNHLVVECTDYVWAECVYSNAYQEAMY